MGTGFIGAEVAATCRRTGLEVIALEAGAVPLERALGRRVGDIYLGIHRDHGVDLRTSETVASFRGQGRVEQVVTAAGAIDCDLVVVGIGVEPTVDWLAGSGLAIDNGLVTDEYCRTNLPDVSAAGDIANWWHPTLGEHLRVEHFDNAEHQGVAAAKNLLGRGEPYAPVPYFWSDQYDLTLEYVGHASGQDLVVLRGTVESGAWSAFYLRDGRLRAALAVNRTDDIEPARVLIAGQVPLTAQVLSDEQIDLRMVAERRSAPAVRSKA